MVRPWIKSVAVKCRHVSIFKVFCKFRLPKRNLLVNLTFDAYRSSYPDPSVDLGEYYDNTLAFVFSEE
jgi:hypothetical protein